MELLIEDESDVEEDEVVDPNLESIHEEKVTADGETDQTPPSPTTPRRRRMSKMAGTEHVAIAEDSHLKTDDTDRGIDAVATQVGYGDKIQKLRTGFYVMNGKKIHVRVLRQVCAFCGGGLGALLYTALRPHRCDYVGVYTARDGPCGWRLGCPLQLPHESPKTEAVSTRVSPELFATSVCLPHSSGMTL